MFIFHSRYELREDRKRETTRAYSQIDSLKKDILRLLRQNTNTLSNSASFSENLFAAGKDCLGAPDHTSEASPSSNKIFLYPGNVSSSTVV